jgi:hypothetical protein
MRAGVSISLSHRTFRSLSCSVSWAASHAPYGYDEADYMSGVRLGRAGDYLDTNALSFAEFVKTGWKAVRKQISRARSA